MTLVVAGTTPFYNADWIIENQVGLPLRDFRHIVPAVAELMQPENYRRFRDKAAARKNNAVFEIPGIRERIPKTCEIRS